MGTTYKEYGFLLVHHESIIQTVVFQKAVIAAIQPMASIWQERVLTREFIDEFSFLTFLDNYLEIIRNFLTQRKNSNLNKFHLFLKCISK